MIIKPISTFIIAVALCCITTRRPVNATDEYDVFLLAGQSNMDGRGLVKNLSADQQNPIADAIIFYRNPSQSSDGWRNLVPGFSVPPKYKGKFPSPTFGPEIGFARSMLQRQPGRKLALIKGSKGGTSLRVDWKPGLAGDTSSQGLCYRAFIETTRIALDQLSNRGDRFSIRGLLWHQGESDSRSSSDAYRRRLNEFITRVREDLAVPDLPVVVGEVFDNGKRDSVRLAIQTIATESPTVEMASSKGTTTSDPGTHFDAKSQLLLGERYANAIHELSLSNESSRTPSRAFPEFSWDHIPLYMHVRKAGSYTNEEIRFLARFPLITFEKANGHEEHGTVEAGTLIAARAVKQINPKTTILYYRNTIVHYGHYEADEMLADIPNAMLKDANGNTHLVRNRVEAYDLSNAEVRTWWAKSCSSMTADPSIDGIFLDGNIKAMEPGYLRQQIGIGKKKQTMKGYHLMMKQTRAAIGPDKLMVANILRARFKDAGLEYMDYFDGSYLEGFFHSVGGVSYEDYVARGIDAMQKAAQGGKIIAFTTGFAPSNHSSVMGIDESVSQVGSDAEARKALVYPLAIFLICAEKHSYFRVHEGYSANENDRWMRWLPEYDRPLGPPNGPATKNGFRYSRSFQHASISVDIRNRTAEINWKIPAGNK